ncbi:MAG: hypothetical protein AAFY65_15565 [Pseudomonadota bacterium]
MRTAFFLALFATATMASAQDTRQVFLQDGTGAKLPIATVFLSKDGTYQFELVAEAFTDHFLSMRPFRCIEGPTRHLCHVPYPYDIARDISDDLVDLEYDLLFVWKGATEYGINMWNGLYWTLEEDGDQWVGTLHEMDMDHLSAPPPAGDMRPIQDVDLEPADPDGHWMPFLTVE